MDLKSGIAKLSGESSHWALRSISKSGTGPPGKLAMRIGPNILANLAKDYETVIVAGTDGRIMITALIVNALKEKCGEILTNPSGSNMQQGIVTVFLSHKTKRHSRELAVLEVDEISVRRVTELLHPKAYVLTNIFRDQMDRYGEIYTTYDKVTDGIKLAPDAVVITNGDTSIFSSAELPNKKIFYGFGTEADEAQNDSKTSVDTGEVLCPKCNHIIHYYAIGYASLGDCFCPNCGLKRPSLNYKLEETTERTPNSVKFRIKNTEFAIGIGGTHNIYNALAAFSVARKFDISEAEIANAFAKNKRVSGRQELISYTDREINLILVKNSVGLNEVLSLLNTEKSDYTLATLLNAHHTGGIDTSWIWGVDHEGLGKSKVRQVPVGGERHHDVGFRLEAAGFDPEAMGVTPDDNTLLTRIEEVPTEKVYILATYTVMLALRSILYDQEILKDKIN